MPFEVVLDATLARITLVTGKGALGTWRSPCGQRRQSEEPRVTDESRGKPKWVGVYASECLSLTCLGKASRGKAKAKTGIGKSDLPGLQGGPRKRDSVSHDSVRAPRLYPDPGQRRSGQAGNESCACAG
jgi:hypothetical protein